MGYPGAGGKPEAASGPIPTDAFALWLDRTVKSRETGAGMDVPCGDCRGCCTSSYFIHIAPDEKDALARIPKRLLFAAPGLPKGHVLMGYDERGHCPMFVANACSIYAHRPRTCREYDCRVFAAAGLSEGADKPAIAERSARWRFGLESEKDRRYLQAVRAAAKFLREHAGRFPQGFVPINPAQQAMLAIESHELFLDPASGRDVGAMVDALVSARARRFAKRRVKKRSAQPFPRFEDSGR